MRLSDPVKWLIIALDSQWKFVDIYTIQLSRNLDQFNFIHVDLKEMCGFDICAPI